MPKASTFHHAFNVGIVDKDKLVRVDQQRMRLAAEVQTNLLPTTTGKAFLRPGQEYISNTRDNGEVRLKEFVASSTSAALLEWSAFGLRVQVDGAFISRPAVSCTIPNGGFDTSTSWELLPTAGAQAFYAGSQLYLQAGAKGSEAVARQQVGTGSPGIEHALRIEIDRGPVTFKCGSAAGADDYISETELKSGIHSLAFVPSGSFWLELSTKANVFRSVMGIQIEAPGQMLLPTPYAASDLYLIRMSQSADVAFIATQGYRPMRLERRSERSWSFVRYMSDTGPFSAGRTAEVRLRPSVTQGNGTLFATERFFRPGHVGALFKIFHANQQINQPLAGEGQYTDPIEVTGIEDDRRWAYAVSGTWTGTLRVYRSFDGPEDGYRIYRYADDQTALSIPANGSYTNIDEDDNAIIWYRIGFGDGEYGSGAASISISSNGGGGYGICRVLSYVNPQEVEIEILDPFSSTTWSDDWQEGEWSDYRGHPAASSFFEGRLWWGGSDRFWGSVSDDYENFDEELEGDKAPISRSIATGGVCQTQWMMPLARLVFGTDASEVSARSSSFDEPLTATNLTLKNSSTIGSLPIDPVKIDGRCLFVDRAGASLFEMLLSADAGDFSSTDISRLNSDLFRSGIRELAVQRRPDTRVWVITNDGAMVCFLYEPTQEAWAYVPFKTDGLYESVAVLPALGQDRVFLSVRRSINGGTARFIERLAVDEDARPITISNVMDASVRVISATPFTTVGGFAHLEGKSLKVWADGSPLMTVDEDNRPIPRLLTVSGGQITLPAPALRMCAGLPYEGRFKSARLAYGAEGTAMLRKKRIDSLGIVMTDFVRAGVRYGSKLDDLNHPLDPLPVMSDYETAPAIVLADVHDESPFVFDGEWSTDSRVCLEADWPVALLGLTMTISTNE